MRLSRDLDQLKPHYDAIVIGSGYGAGVAASRMARMGLAVAVLERGREFPIGEFPDSAPDAMQEFQYTLEGTHHGRRNGLYDLHVGRDMHALVGCGLGGTSLINANVSLPPDPRVWEDPIWPHDLFTDDTLNQGFDRAKAMLRPLPYPGTPKLPKLDRLAEAAKRLDVPLSNPPINVAFTAGPNAAGVNQPACNGCGDCCSGCNVGAKTTVQMTYLPDAFNHGAEIFTDATVRHLRKEDGRWRISYVVTSQRRDHFQQPERTITAEIVVVGAGSLGSTEILLRSQKQGLAVSDRLGQSFTGNGDVLAFAWNGEKPVDAIGIGEPPKANATPPGPCITGALDLRGNGPLNDGMIIEEGVMPSGLAEILPGIFNVGGKLFGKNTTSGYMDAFQESIRRNESWLLGAYRGAMNHTATYLVMAHDGAGGRIALDDDRAHIHWPEASSQQVYKRIEDKLIEVSTANSATYIRNPIQNTFLGKTLITVHPLGGCGMGTDRTLGVVDQKCRVFDASPGAAPNAVHDGLYVVDGATVPRPLGVNPLMTITALAERAMIHLAADIGKPLDVAKSADKPVMHLIAEPDAAALARNLVRKVKTGAIFTDLTGGASALGAMITARAAELSAAASVAKSAIDLAKEAATTANTAPATTPQAAAHDRHAPVGVEFTERMAGYISDRASADYRAAETVGRTFENQFAFTVNVRIVDVDEFILDPMHEGTLTGTAICKWLSREPLDISQGIFRLMRKSDDAVETRLFEYQMQLTARDGQSYTFRGHKNVHDDVRPADLIVDTTTLFIDIAERGNSGRSARGVLTIKPDDFAKQIRTLRGFGGTSAIDRNAGVVKFGALFAGTLFDVYGNIFAPLKRYNPERLRKKRGLRAGTPQVHFFPTRDGKTLRLTRYDRDGASKKGPILFTHGLGVSSQIFSIDTIDTNLLEYLCERGFDCWLLDFRASIDLPYAKDRWTADDCARFDYQPAVDHILAHSGATSVQVMAHCFGSTTFVMSVLGGHLTGVRSAVISQIAADVLVPFFPQRLLAFLRLPELLDKLGIGFVNARASTEQGFANRTIDALIRVAVPFKRDARSRNATSNRITALYGQLYEIDQLNALTFDSGLAEMFGEANIDAFKQLARLARATVLVDANGEDSYMPHLDRLAFPICFIHGAENGCFKPESTARTMEKLVARNGGRLYERHLIPNYGHIDCIFGKNAAVDVYPKIHEHLEKSAQL